MCQPFILQKYCMKKKVLGQEEGCVSITLSRGSATDIFGSIFCLFSPIHFLELNLGLKCMQMYTNGWKCVEVVEQLPSMAEEENSIRSTQ